MSRGSGSLVVGVLGSTALHAGLAGMLLVWPAGADVEPRADGAALLILPQPPEPALDVTLGLDDERATGEAWLGTVEPTPHATPEAGQVEQAALSPSPSPGEAAPPAVVAKSEPELRVESQRSDTTYGGARAPASVQTTPEPAAEESQVGERAVERETEAPAAVHESVEVSLPEDAPIDSASKPGAGEAEERWESPEGAAGASATIVREREQEGLPDRRESDAVSRTAVVDAVPGRPLSARGLEITTVRPRWSISTRMTRDPSNPTVRLTFGRSGRVIGVEFVRSTGFADVDEPLRTALYKWTARGAALASLPERTDPTAAEPGITITVRVVLR